MNNTVEQLIAFLRIALVASAVAVLSSCAVVHGHGGSYSGSDRYRYSHRSYERPSLTVRVPAPVFRLNSHRGGHRHDH